MLNSHHRQIIKLYILRLQQVKDHCSENGFGLFTRMGLGLRWIWCWEYIECLKSRCYSGLTARPRSRGLWRHFSRCLAWCRNGCIFGSLSRGRSAIWIVDLIWGVSGSVLLERDQEGIVWRTCIPSSTSVRVGLCSPFISIIFWFLSPLGSDMRSSPLFLLFDVGVFGAAESRSPILTSRSFLKSSSSSRSQNLHPASLLLGHRQTTQRTT